MENKWNKLKSWLNRLFLPQRVKGMFSCDFDRNVIKNFSFTFGFLLCLAKLKSSIFYNEWILEKQLISFSSSAPKKEHTSELIKKTYWQWIFTKKRKFGQNTHPDHFYLKRIKNLYPDHFVIKGPKISVPRPFLLEKDQKLVPRPYLLE